MTNEGKHLKTRKALNMFENFWKNLKIDIRFIYQARLRPMYAHKVWGYVYDWTDGKVKQAYWVHDRKGNIIPWAHFDKHAIMCCYPEDIDNKRILKRLGFYKYQEA